MWRLASTGLLILVSIPVGTIYRQNIEEWAKGHGLDRLLSDGTGMFVTNPWGLPFLALFFVLLGSTAALWLQYLFQTKFSGSSAKNPKELTIKKIQRPALLKHGNKDTILASDRNDFDLILRPEQPVVARAKRTDDGTDLIVRVVLRNRSKRPLWIDVVGRFPMTFDGDESDKLSGGATRPFGPESNIASIFGETRAYHGVAGRIGNGRISYLFGENELHANWVFDVDVDFKILEEPKKNGVEEIIPVEIIANRSAYRPKTDEGQ